MAYKKIPIVTCTTGSPSAKVLEFSVKTYAPEHEFIMFHNEPSSFGEAFNAALDEVFKTHDEVIISNDDVVITPWSVPLLLEDVETIKKQDSKIGFVVSMCDFARAVQNIRIPAFGNEDKIIYTKWKSEGIIKKMPVVSPIFSWMSKKTFEEARFPPISWFSDDVICEDLAKLGYSFYVSRSYVHHVGSNTIGRDGEKLEAKAYEWVRVHRPEYVELFESRK